MKKGLPFFQSTQLSSFSRILLYTVVMAQLPQALHLVRVSLHPENGKCMAPCIDELAACPGLRSQRKRWDWLQHLISPPTNGVDVHLLLHPFVAIPDPGSGIVCPFGCPSCKSVAALLVHKELIWLHRGTKSVIRSRLVRGQDLAIQARPKLWSPRHSVA